MRTMRWQPATDWCRDTDPLDAKMEHERLEAGLPFFAKHRNTPLSRVPEDDLRWCLRKLTRLKRATRDAINLELKRRQSQ